MKKSALLLVLVLLGSGCVDRIGALSPRRTNTEAHRQAGSNQDCLGCHNVAGQRYHHPKDNCLNCHKLTYGGVQ